MKEGKVSFKEIYGLDLRDKTEKKGKFNYLSWAYAWAEIKKLDENAVYKVLENNAGMPFFYEASLPNLGAFVKVEVVFNGVSQVITHPILDNFNKAVVVEKLNAFIINTSIQRALAKCCSLHGLGLYIYAGEDLPETSSDNQKPEEFFKEAEQFLEQDKKSNSPKIKVEKEGSNFVNESKLTEPQFYRIEKILKDEYKVEITPEIINKIKGLTLKQASSYISNTRNLKELIAIS